MGRPGDIGVEWDMAVADRSDEGFTLVEVIAAVVLFVAISASTITILLLALNTIEGNNDRVIAANVARSRIEQLRVLGSDQVVPGLTFDQPAGTPPDFSVETSAQWVGAGQSVSSCEAAAPGQAYLRVRVDVSGPDEGAVAVMDTIIAPDATATSVGTAAIAISVEDQQGSPVSGVTVSAVDSLSPENSFTYLTGSDGCLYIPGLTAGRDLDISVSKNGYVPPTPTGDQGTSTLDAGTLAKPSFLLAPASGIDFTGAQAGYPVPAGTPVTWQVNETGALSEIGAIGTPVTGRWPNPGGFTAWVGDCPDADPGEYAQPVQTFDFTPGGSTLADLTLGLVDISGLPAGATVTASHVGPCDPDSTSLTLDLGTAGEDGTLTAGLPFGSWEFTAEADRETDVNGEIVIETLTETVPLDGPLAPDAQAPSAVVFTLAEQVAPSPSPSGSGDPSTSPSPAPEPSP